MAAITAQMVKALREKTGAGMMDCKKALTESGGDMDGAIEILRKSGMAKAAKKVGRTTNEGVIASRIDGGVAVLAEVLCETDFVARTDAFRKYTEDLLARVLNDWDGDGDLSAEAAAKETEAIGELVAQVGENVAVRRVVRWTSEDGKFAAYLHGGGRIGVLIEVAGEASDELMNDICMHIAAFAPRYIAPESVPAEVLAKEKEIAAAQVQGKPANIIDKIVAGKINKWYTEVCLVRQPWLRDDKSTLAKVAPGITVRRFLRWQVGEDLEG